MLFMAVYQVVDGAMVGRRLGPEALASVNILYPILALIVGLAVMIGTGGNARIAVLLGNGEVQGARRTLGLTTLLGMLLGVTSSLLILTMFPTILGALGVSGTLGVYAGEYLRSMYPFFVPMILIFILEQSVRNDGQPNLATGVIAASCLLNIFLDYIFLFTFDMGMAGAALATGISKTVGASILLGYFILKTIRHQPGLALAVPAGGLRVIASISINGSSELFSSLAMGLTTLLFNRLLLGYIGAMGVAAFSLVQYLLMLGAVIFMGIGSGIQPIISYNHGAGLVKRVSSTLYLSLITSLAIGFLLFMILRRHATPLVALFIVDNPEALEIAISASNFLSWSFIFMPIGVIGSVFFTALEQAGKSLIVAASRGLVFTVIGLTLFPYLWGETGIWITPVFAEIVTTLITLALIFSWSRQTHTANKSMFLCQA